VRPAAATRSIVRRGRGVAVCLPLALVAVASIVAPVRRAVAGGDAAPAASDFARVVNGWQSRSATSVRAEVPKDGRLRIDLLGTGDGRVTGQPTAEQAEAVLQDYFSHLDSASLVDASGDSKGFSRTYDYTYRPTGGTARTTRLTFTLTALASGGYGLSAVVERAKKT
jgi:hypothetical protein